jgi:hypothetical protein
MEPNANDLEKVFSVTLSQPHKIPIKHSVPILRNFPAGVSDHDLFTVLTEGTFNTLTGKTPGTLKSTEMLSDSYSNNQIIFKNQLLRWWENNLNSGVIKYTPISNEINWSYKTFAIDKEITSYIIPSHISTVTTKDEYDNILFTPTSALSRVRWVVYKI